MAVYLIDYENVSVSGLDGIEKLKEDDEVYIFYSEKAQTLTFGLHKKLGETHANVHYMKLDVGGKNALDIQLASYLGFLIKECMECEYYIVSKDQGFTKVAQFWNKQKIKVKVTENMSGYTRNEARSKIQKEVQHVLKDKNEIDFVCSSIEQLATKSGVNNRLMKKYGSTRAGEIYKLIKPLLKDKKGR